jgi:DNA-binding FrmR family transcriptional regulator
VLQFIQYVEAFLQAVAAVWGVIFPLIPAAAQAQAQSDYSNAVFTIEQAVQAIEDALKAAAAASQPVPDLSKLIAAVQAAVDALMKIIGAWQGGSAAGDAGTTAQASPRGATPAQIAELQRQQTVIHSWK